MKYIWTKQLPFLICFFTTAQQIAIIIIISAITKTPPPTAAMMMIMVFVKKGFLGSWIVVETVGEEIDVDDEPMDEVITPVEFFFYLTRKNQ